MADNQSREVRKPIEKGTEVTSVKYPNGKWLVTRDEGDGVRVVEKDSDFATFLPDGTYDIIENNPGTISLKVDVDCSEALTGLKALTREARKATQAIAELDSEAQRFTTKYTDASGVLHYAEWMQQGDEVSEAKHVKVADVLAKVPTAELTEELARRMGVFERVVDAHGGYAKLSIDNHREGSTETFTGPCRVLVVTD